MKFSLSKNISTYTIVAFALLLMVSCSSDDTIPNPVNNILSPQSIRTPKNISNLNFKALTKIELASMNTKEFEALMIENIEIRQFGNTVVQNELISKTEKEIGLASLTAKERLIEFRKKYHLLENLISHTDIASYLGITNISLSRLRKDLSRY